MKHEADLAKGWLLKGDSDLASAKLIITSAGPYDTACFHAQQAVEKYLKGALALSGQQVPRTHDLEELQLLCVSFLIRQNLLLWLLKKFLTMPCQFDTILSSGQRRQMPSRRYP